MALYNWLIAENAGKQYKSVFYIVDKNKIIRYFLRMKNSVGYFYLKAVTVELSLNKQLRKHKIRKGAARACLF